MALPLPHRIKGRESFQAVFKEGRSVHGNFLLLKIIENHRSVSRFGFVVSVKVSPLAVTRNAIRRALSEDAKSLVASLKKGYDIGVLVKKKPGDPFNRELEYLLKKAKLL